jgi:protein TonB
MLWPWVAASVAIHGTFLLWPEAHDRALTSGHEYIVEITSAAPPSSTQSAAPAEKRPSRKSSPVHSVAKSAASIVKDAEKSSEPLAVAGQEESVPNSPSADEAGRESIVRNHLEHFKYYPGSARRRGIIGDVEVAFQLDAKGRAGMLKILSASGYRILDDAALETVRRAQPFPAASGAFQFRLHFGAS